MNHFQTFNTDTENIKHCVISKREGGKIYKIRIERKYSNHRTLEVESKLLTSEKKDNEAMVQSSCSGSSEPQFLVFPPHFISLSPSPLLPSPPASKILFSHILFLFFWPHCMACGILVPRRGIEPVTPAVAAQSPNHWTAREVPSHILLNTTKP